MHKFTQELKDKWLAALRSGEYKQGKKSLCDGGRFCCLGVLCDVAKFKSRNPLIIADDTLARFFLIGCAQQNILANLNDSGKTFKEIADIIEAMSLGTLIDGAA